MTDPQPHPDRQPLLDLSLPQLVTAVALGLVVLAARTGVDLVTQDVAATGFTARLLAQVRG